jgi:hypothetical protein
MRTSQAPRHDKLRGKTWNFSKNHDDVDIRPSGNWTKRHHEVNALAARLAMPIAVGELEGFAVLCDASYR